MTAPAHMTVDQAEAYRDWLQRIARRATGRMREWLLAGVSKLEESEWSFL